MADRDIKSEEGKLGGEPFLEETRIRVTDIYIKYEKLGYSVEELLQAYPKLDRSDIHEALAYYYRNEDEMNDSVEKISAGAKA